MKRTLRLLALLTVALLLFGCCLVPRMVYPAPALAVPSPPPFPLQEVILEDGCVSWVLESPRSEAPALVWCHGNGENLETLRRSGQFKRFEQMGVAVVAADYPGYGNSPGSPREDTVVASVRAACREARRRWPDRPLVLAGWSIGTGPVFQVAAGDKPDAVVAISPFTSLKAVASEHYPSWLASMLLGDDYDSLGVAGSLTCPVLVIHGEDDGLIPASHGRRLVQALPNAKGAFLPNAGHNDLMLTQAAWTAMAEFLKTLCR